MCLCDRFDLIFSIPDAILTESKMIDTVFSGLLCSMVAMVPNNLIIRLMLLTLSQDTPHLVCRFGLLNLIRIRQTKLGRSGFWVYTEHSIQWLTRH